MRVSFGAGEIELVQGNLALFVADVLVTAANSALAGGGGVDGAIHQAAGPALLEELRRRFPEGCPTGSAVLTAPGKLPVRAVIHAVGPIWEGGHRQESELLRSAYRKSLELAVEHGFLHIAFPAISTGVYRFPIDLAAERSLDETRLFLTTSPLPLKVTFVLYDTPTFSAYARVLEAMTASA